MDIHIGISNENKTETSNLRHTRTVVHHICGLCGKKYVSQSHLKEHMKQEHDLTINRKKATLKCPLCPHFLKTYGELDEHMNTQHKVTIEHIKNTFQDIEAFKKWKTETEQATGSSYIKLNAKKSNSHKVTRYVCYRSGFYKPELGGTTRTRKLKRNGSNKIGGHCPSRLKCIEDGDGVTVNYIATHVGHDIDVARLPLTTDDRHKIAGKLLQGIPGEQILQDINKTIDSSKRLSVTTKQDIRNIQKSGILQDVASVQTLIEKLGDAVLGYKAYGVKDAVLSDSDFFLVFMNSAQKELLLKYGNQTLMIDSTLATNRYNIKLTTLMVADEYEGFPVAFLWSVAQNKAVFDKFFSCIKKCVPDLQPKSVMSDDAFYNAFVRAYSCIPNMILPDWLVKKNLNDNLTKIDVLEKRLDIKKKLELLVNEPDINKFNKMLPVMINRLTSDPDLKTYGEYFCKYYANRSSQWAHCHRKGFVKNANVGLEKWHRELAPGKCHEKLDLNINNVLECLRTKFMRRLISVSRNKVLHKLAELKRQHKIAEQFIQSAIIVEEIPGTKWLVSSSENTNMFTVMKIQDKCVCTFICSECKCCLHMFTCSCHDYTLQFDMCKHIHLVSKRYNTYLLEPVSESSSQVIEEQDLQIEKKIALQKLHDLEALVVNCESLDTVTYVSSNLQTIMSGLIGLRKNED